MADKVTTRIGEPGSPPAPRSNHPLMTLRDEVDRLFDTFFPSMFGRSLLETDPWTGRAFRTLGDISPRMDVAECGDRYDISVELPGMDEKDVAVKVHGDVLTISGEKKAERTEDKGATHLTERSYGSFTRSVRLPDDADAESIKADYAKGVLTISVPKSPQGKNEKKIEVTTH
ncbi:MAG TPA: Hsp20/alpha crystallin family protein [Magnetospirillum sp.]|nr:Hsp20/alpha crystallin family protein [Magnetospirillum sp.]